MANWTAVLEFGLNNIGKQYGLVGLGNLYAAFAPQKGSQDPFQDLISYFSTIESQLNTLTTQISGLESDVNKLVAEISGIEVAQYYTQIKTAYSNIVDLSTTQPTEANPLSKIQGNMQKAGNEMANTLSGIYNICNELNTFLLTNASAGQGFINEFGANSNADYSLLPFYIRMKSICSLYMAGYSKAIVCVRWLEALNAANVIDFVEGDKWIQQIEEWQSNLVDAFNEQVPVSAQNLIAALGNLPTQTDSAGNLTFLQNGYFPLWPDGVDIRISSNNFPKNYLGFMEPGEAIEYSLFANCQSPANFKLVPVSPVANASASQDVHFALFYSSDTFSSGYLLTSFLGPYITNSGSMLEVSWSTLPGKNNMLSAGKLPPRFSLFLNPDGTFSIKWYSDYGAAGSSTGDKDIPLIQQKSDTGLETINFAKDSKDWDRTSTAQQFTLTPLVAQQSLDVIYSGAKSLILYTSSFDGKDWAGNERIGPLTGDAYPGSDMGVAATNYHNNLLIAYKGDTTTNFYYGYNNGQNWQANILISDDNSEQLKTSARPALATCAGLAYMVYKAASSKQLYFVHFDGSLWRGNTKISNTSSDQPPSLAADINLLYLALKGESSNNIYINTYDTLTEKWSGLSKITSDSNGISTEAAPSIVMFQNRLMLIFKAAGGDELYFSVMDGNKWADAKKITTKSNATLSCSRAATTSVYQGQLYLAYNGASDDYIYYSTYDGTSWSDASKVKTDNGSPVTGVTPVLTSIAYSYSDMPTSS